MRYPFLLSILLLFTHTVQAQKTSLTPAFKEATVKELTRLVDDFYVFPEVGRKTSAHLNKQLAAGHFDQFTELEPFAEALTQEMQSINQDKHLRVMLPRPTKARENTTERFLEEHLHRLTYQRENAGGFKEAKKLEGNVGYLDVRNFAPVHIAAKFADSYLQLLSASDAIIVDMRKNGGGSPDMVQYLCSYFFGESVHLNSLYFREDDRTIDFRTIDVAGKSLPDVPLFVLISAETFSGAEEFSYNMQTQERATLVGQTTRGGANPGQMMRINERLSVFLPKGRAINPITKTNWEGVGVVPEIKTSPEETFDKAYELAKAAAEAYRAGIRKEQEALTATLVESLENFDTETGSEAAITNLKKCQKAGLLDEGTINVIGYEYLMRFQKPVVAEAVFRANMLLFPTSANAYDSYAEALGVNGKRKACLEHYQKAVQLAEAAEAPDLIMYQENLAKAMERFR